jgi:predicted acyl esterase
MKNDWTRRSFLKTAGAGSVLMSTNLATAKGQESEADNSITPWFLDGNGPWAKNLSQPNQSVMFEFDVKIPLRDGIRLSANIWRPKALGKYPVRYRESFVKQELISPGTVYEYTIDLMSISHLFQKGNRIQLEISSSNFPNYDRNPNTGKPLGSDTELRKATQRIFHDRRYPSHVILPVVPR